MIRTNVFTQVDEQMKGCLYNQKFLLKGRTQISDKEIEDLREDLSQCDKLSTRCVRNRLVASCGQVVTMLIFCEVARRFSFSMC